MLLRPFLVEKRAWRLDRYCRSLRRLHYPRVKGFRQAMVWKMIPMMMPPWSLLRLHLLVSPSCFQHACSRVRCRSVWDLAETVVSICVDQSCHSMASIANRYCCCLVEKLGFSLTLRPGAGSAVANVDFASFPLGILSHPFGSSCRHVV